MLSTSSATLFDFQGRSRSRLNFEASEISRRIDKKRVRGISKQRPRHNGKLNEGLTTDLIEGLIDRPDRQKVRSALPDGFALEGDTQTLGSPDRTHEALENRGNSSTDKVRENR